MRLNRLLAIILVAFWSQLSIAETPSLVGIDYFGDSDQPQKLPLRIDELSFELDVHPGFVHTTMVATFGNPSDEELEAEFTLKLPADTVVTGYALDIQGKLVPGVIVEKEVAREVVEADR